MNVDNEIEKINSAISELVYDKTVLQKAYNYYHGVRDAEQFKYLEDNYGLGTPTAVGFNPLVRPHIDRLVGEYIGLNPDLKISCKDSDTVNNIFREKQLKIAEETHNYVKKHLENIIIKTFYTDQETTQDPFILQELEKIKQDVEESFISSYEIAAQNILDYIKQSRFIDLSAKACAIFTDLSISGTAYYRTRPTVNKENIRLEVLNPIDTFIEKNPNSTYLADSRRAVVRKYMSVEDIISEYHPHLTKDHIETLKTYNVHSDASSSATYVVATSPEIKCT